MSLHIPPTEFERFTQKLIISRDDLKSLGVWQSNTTLLRMEANGRFPRRIRLSASCVAWDKEEVFNWLEERRAERAHWVYADAS